jgi:hypothetical protein
VPPPEPKLAAALAFRQRRIVLEAIGFAVDGFLDRALCGSRVLVLIARTGLRIDIRRLRCLRSCNRHGAENHQNRIVKSKPVLVMSALRSGTSCSMGPSTRSRRSISACEGPLPAVFSGASLERPQN